MKAVDATKGLRVLISTSRSTEPEYLPFDGKFGTIDEVGSGGVVWVKVEMRGRTKRRWFHVSALTKVEK